MKVCRDTHHRGFQARLSDVVDTQQCNGQDEQNFQPVANLQGFETWESVTKAKKEVVAARKPALSEEHTVKQSIPKCYTITCGAKFSTGSCGALSVFIAHADYYKPATLSFQIS